MSLWYRPPEVLLGECAYTEAVDVWSAGCIFAEMLRGAVLFRGISQIEQLFQIFSKLGTPSEQTWPGISSMRFYREGVFPLWSAAAATASDGTAVGGEGSYSLAPLVRAATSRDLDLLGRCLRCCPENRCSAQQIKQILFEQPNIQEWCGASGSQQQMQISSRTWHSSSSELEQAIRISGVPLSQGRLREYLSSTTSSSCSCSSSSSSSDGGNRELVWSQLCHMQSTEDEDLQRPHKKAVRGCLVALKAQGPYIAAVEFICRIHHAKSAGKVGPQRSLHLAVSVLDQFLCAAAMAGCVGMTTPTMRWCSSFLGGSGSAFSSANYEVEKDPEAMSALLFELLVLSMACIQIASKYEDLTFLDAQEIIGLAQSLVIADEDTLLEVRSEREQNEFILQLLKPGGAGPIFGIAETKPPMKLTKVLEAEAEGACVCGKGEMDTCSDLESELQGEDGTQQTDVNRWDEPCKQPFYLMTRLEQVGAADVLVAEELVLRALDLRVRAAPAMIDFLGIYSTECFHLADVLNNSDIGSVKFHCPNFRLMPSSDDSIACDEADSSCSHFPHSFLASFLALAGEVSLSSGECAAIPPSLLAASLLTLSLYVHQEACWAIGRLLTNSSSGSEKSSQHSISPVQMVEVASEGYRLPWFDHILRCWAGFSLHQLRDCMLGLCAALRAHVAQQVYNLPARHISVSLAQNSHACFQITLRNLLGKVDWHRLEGWISALGPEKDVL